MLRIIFLGTPEFACPSLEAVIAAGYAVSAVVTQPDQPAGRGGKLTPPPVKRLAERLGIPVLQPRRVRRPEAVAALQELHPDLLVTAAFGQILSPAVLAVPRIGSLNVHASLLPAYRGAAPIHRAVLEGAAETGVTIMWMDEGLDTGDMLLWQATPIGPEETAGSLHDRLSHLGAELLVQALGGIAAGTAPRLPQDHSRATYAHKLTPADERIDWGDPARCVLNRVRGLNPWPVAHTTWRGNLLKVWQAAAATEPPVAGPASPPGTVLAADPARGLVVAVADGAVSLLAVQPAGKRPMPAGAFVAGYRPQPGDRLGEPIAAG